MFLFFIPKINEIKVSPTYKSSHKKSKKQNTQEQKSFKDVFEKTLKETDDNNEKQ